VTIIGVSIFVIVFVAVAVFLILKVVGAAG
jgi:hypothetical protein